MCVRDVGVFGFCVFSKQRGIQAEMPVRLTLEARSWWIYIRLSLLPDALFAVCICLFNSSFFVSNFNAQLVEARSLRSTLVLTELNGR
jgi:hypothetical protein